MCEEVASLTTLNFLIFPFRGTEMSWLNQTGEFIEIGISLLRQAEIRSMVSSSVSGASSCYRQHRFHSWREIFAQMNGLFLSFFRFSHTCSHSHMKVQFTPCMFSSYTGNSSFEEVVSLSLKERSFCSAMTSRMMGREG